MIRKININTICDIYPCNNQAVYAVGNEFDPMNNIHVCRECGKKLFTGLGELLVEGYTTHTGNEKNMPNLQFFSEILKNVTNDVVWLDKQSEADTAVSDLYICKFCGETFPKTAEGLGAYRNHTMAHGSRKKAKK